MIERPERIKRALLRGEQRRLYKQLMNDFANGSISYGPITLNKDPVCCRCGQPFIVSDTLRVWR